MSEWDFRMEYRSLRNRAAHWGCELHTGEGVECTLCENKCLALPVNQPCGHVACSSCWARHVEGKLPPSTCTSRSLGHEGMPHVQCLCCEEEMSWPLLCVI